MKFRGCYIMRLEIEKILCDEFEKFVSKNNLVVGYEKETYDDYSVEEYVKLNDVCYSVGFNICDNSLKTVDNIIKLQNFINNSSDLITVNIIIEEIIDGLLYYCEEKIYCDFYIRFKNNI